MKPVKPYKTTYHPANAYWMARLAKEVYTKVSDDDKPDEQKILASLLKDDGKFVRVNSFNRKSTQAMVVEHEKYIAIAFRGTDKKGDRPKNLDDIQVQSDELFGVFHSRFYDAVQDVWPRIQKSVKAITDKKPRPVWFTGHSLGGALAVIAAAIIIHEGKTLSGLYTFGQPRCMNLGTCSDFNRKTTGRYFRFQNNNDIVTHFPSHLTGYCHGGQCIYISEEKKLSKSSGFWPKFLGRADVVGVANTIREEQLDENEDHDMDKYLSAVKDWEDKPVLDD